MAKLLNQFIHNMCNMSLNFSRTPRAILMNFMRLFRNNFLVTPNPRNGSVVYNVCI